MVGQLVVDVQISNLFPIGKFRYPSIDLVNDRHYQNVVVAREDSHQHNCGARRLSAADIENGFDSAGNVFDPGIVLALGRVVSDIVGAGEQDNNSGLYVIQLPLVKTPEYVLRFVSAPAEIGGIPAEEVLLPVPEKVFVLFVARAPTSRDRVAFEININLTPLRLLD